MTTPKQILSLLLAMAMPLSLLAARDLTDKMDPELGKQIEAKIRAAALDGNYEAALRELRRSLEIYPNEPLMRAPIYFGMSEMSAKSGDAKHAQEYRTVSEHLDPQLRMRLAAGAESVSRGDKADMWAGIFAAGLQTASTIMQQRQLYLQQQQQRQQMALQAQAQGVQQVQPLVQAQQAMQASTYYYPAAPAGQPGYQVPPNGYAPPVGYAPAPVPNYVQPPPPSQYAAPQYAQPSGQPMIQPGQPAPTFVQPPAPYTYAPPPGYPVPPTRGEQIRPIRVLHDHAQIGDTAYFGHVCGALLSTSGSALVFTPAGGEIPMIIPSSEISEIKLNTVIGKSNGTFHVVTRKGFYLSLVPESGDRDDARATIATLKKQLGLTD